MSAALHPAIVSDRGPLHEHSLVTLHKPGRREIIGRITYTQASGVFVIDLHRSSRCDVGYRLVESADVVHFCLVRCDCGKAS